jgi:hypothetical protein
VFIRVYPWLMLFSLLAPEEAAQTEDFGNRDDEVEETQAADRAAEVVADPLVPPFWNESGKVVRFPVFGPREEEEKRSDFGA